MNVFSTAFALTNVLNTTRLLFVPKNATNLLAVLVTLHDYQGLQNTTCR